MASDQSKKFVAALLGRLKEQRSLSGIKLEQLAEASKVDIAVISRAENLRRIPSLALIRDLALALGMDFAALCKSVEDQIARGD